MASSDFNIEYVARLARLSLSPEEKQKLSGQLGNILTYIETLRQVDVTGIEPTSQAFPMVNVTRTDEITPSLSNEDALRNAPAQSNGLFLMPKIVE